MVHEIWASIDPGVTSGVVVWNVTDKLEVHGAWEIPYSAGLSSVVQAAYAYGASLLVFEDFVIPHRCHGPTEAKKTIEVIGAIKLFCRQRSITCKAIMPSQTKRIDDATLRRYGITTKGVHARDACRIGLFYWLRREKKHGNAC